MHLCYNQFDTEWVFAISVALLSSKWFFVYIFVNLLVRVIYSNTTLFVFHLLVETKVCVIQLSWITIFLSETLILYASISLPLHTMYYSFSHGTFMMYEVVLGRFMVFAISIKVEIHLRQMKCAVTHQLETHYTN